jgi:hypothetical protein
VTNLAGSFLSEVDKVITQADRPIGEKSGFGHSPFTVYDNDFHKHTQTLMIKKLICYFGNDAKNDQFIVLRHQKSVSSGVLAYKLVRL